MRKGLWRKTDAFIKSSNAKEEDFQLGHNQFSDRTDAEKESALGLKDLEAKGDS